MILLTSLVVTYVFGLCFLCWGDIVLWIVSTRTPGAGAPMPFVVYAVFACGIGGIVASLLTYAWGLAHLLYGLTVGGSLLAGPLLAILSGRWRHLWYPTREAAGRSIDMFWRHGPRTQSLGLRLGIAVSFLLIAIIHLLAAAPLYDPDGLTYHMAVPKLYVAQHAITPLLGINELGNKPFAIDMWHVDALLVGVPAVGTMISALCLLLLLATIIAIAYYCLDVHSPTMLVIAALIVLTQPMTAILATWSFVEVPLAWYEALLVLALLRWLTSAQWREALLMGLCGGMVMAGKESGLAALAGVVVLIAATWLVRRHSFATLVKAILLLCLASLVVAGPWYLRDILWMGDITGLGFPLFATLTHTILHNSSLVVTAASTGTGAAINPSPLGRFLLGWLPMSFAPSPPGIPFFPANPLYLLCPLPLLLRRTWPAFCLTALAVLHVYIWQRIPIGYRQFYLYSPLLVLLVIWGWHLLSRYRTRRLSNLSLGATLTGLIVLTPLTFDLSSSFNFALLRDATQVALQPSLGDRFLSRHVPGYRVDQELNRLYGRSKSITFLVAGFSYFYYLSVPYVSIKATPLYQAPTTLSNTDLLHDYLLRRHICGLLTLRQDFSDDLGKGFDVPYYLPTAHALARLFKGPHFSRISDGFVEAIVPVTHGEPSTSCLGQFSSPTAYAAQVAETVRSRGSQRFPVRA